jgi:hypothetical protein
LHRKGEARETIKKPKEVSALHISTKEVNYLKDHLSWELLAAKKCFHHGKQLQDTKLKEVFDTAGRVHQENYVNLLNYANTVAREVQN